MNFQLIGVNHNSAPLDVRERLAISEARLPDAIRTLVKQPGVDEGMVLSTCNRVELLTSSREAADLREFLRSYFGVSPDALHSHIYEFRQSEAVRLYYFEQLDRAGVAKRMGVSLNTVKTHLERAVAALKAYVDEADLRGDQ